MRIIRSVAAGSVLTAVAASPVCSANAGAASDLLPPFRVEAGGKPIDVEVGHAAPLMADFDRDGNVDLLVGQFGGGKVRIYRNLGSNGAPQLRLFSWFQAGGTDGTVPAS
jgi:hypothetical protein